MKDDVKMSSEQKNAIKELDIINKDYIKCAETLLDESKKKLEPFHQKSDEFWNLMEKMEKANSAYPLGHYANFYYKNLEEPLNESFILNWGNKNPNWLPFTPEFEKQIMSQIPDYDKFQQLLGGLIDKAGKLISEVISKNIILIRFAGLNDRYNELKELEKHWWYPVELSQNSYGLKGSYPTYDLHLTIKIPFHKQLMIKYDVLYKTSEALKIKLESLINILGSVNQFIPFAELLPVGRMPSTVVNVEAKSSADDKSVKIGNKNKFNGDTVIGASSIMQTKGSKRIVKDGQGMIQKVVGWIINVVGWTKSLLPLL